MIGDQNDIFGRLNALMPSKWFTGLTPVKDAVLQGIASVFSQTYLLITFVRLQTRLLTSTGVFLDIKSTDFFGSNLPRKTGESDASFLARIQANLLNQTTSRAAMSYVLTVLTGRTPIIFEPCNPSDTGALRTPLSKGYCGVAKAGSLATPFSALIIAYRPVVTPSNSGGAYVNAPKLSALKTPLSKGYTSLLSSQWTQSTDAAIIAAINATKPLNTNIGVSISN